MFTSRAEFRLLLRHGNADLRLTDIGRSVGLISDDQYEKFLKKRDRIEAEIRRLEELRPRLDGEARSRLRDATLEEVSGPCTVAQLLRRQGVSYGMLMEALQIDSIHDGEIIEEVEIQIKYAGYIKRQLQQIDRFKRLETRNIPPTFDYDHIVGFSREVREKLKKVRPSSIGQASRISGVTPAALSLLLVSLEKSKRETERVATHRDLTL
jgi:tRNA uridine 5-carboxymethylaminomethyl modification enzyme